MAPSAAPAAAPLAVQVPPDSASSMLQEMIGSLSGGDLVTKLALSLVIVLIIWALRRLAIRVVVDRIQDPRSRYHASKIVGYVSAVVGVLWIGFLWFERIGSLGTFLGLITAGVAIALRDVIADLAGWLFILGASPFEVGDRIEIDGHRGDVVDIRAMEFSILEIGNWVDADQSTGRLVHIPNSAVFHSPVANSTMQFPYVWNEIPVTVTFESDWRHAKGLLLEIAEREGSGAVAAAEVALRETAKKFLIHYSKLTPTVYTDVVDHGVRLTIRHLVDPRRRRGTAERIWEAILDTFARESHIDLAYPTQRFFDNRTEGKDAVGTDSATT